MPNILKGVVPAGDPDEAARSERHKARIKTTLNVLFLVLGIALFALVIRISGSSLPLLLEQVSSADLSMILAVIVLLWLQSVLLTRRWACLLGLHAETRHLPPGFLFYNINLGLLTTSFLPIYGYIGSRSLSAKLEHDIPLRNSVYAGMIEFLLGLSFILAFFLPGGLYVSHVLSVGPAAAAFGLTALISLLTLSLFLKPILGVFATAVAALRRVPLVDRILPSGAILDRSLITLDRRASIRLSALSLLIFLGHLLRRYAYLKAFHIEVGWLEFGLVYAFGYAVSALGLTPGNLGVAELGWFGILSYVGVGRNQAALFAVGQRFLDTGAVLILALLSYAFYLKRRRGALRGAEETE